MAPDAKVVPGGSGHADWAQAPGLLPDADRSGRGGSWPITGASFILMHKQPKDAGRQQPALKFFDWALKKGQSLAAAARLCADPPAPVVKRVRGDLEASHPESQVSRRGRRLSATLGDASVDAVSGDSARDEALRNWHGTSRPLSFSISDHHSLQSALTRGARRALFDAVTMASAPRWCWSLLAACCWRLVYGALAGAQAPSSSAF